MLRRKKTGLVLEIDEPKRKTNMCNPSPLTPNPLKKVMRINKSKTEK